MKILVFNPSLLAGGAASVASETAAFYRDQGHAVTIVTADGTSLPGTDTLALNQALDWARPRRWLTARLETELGAQYLFRPGWKKIKSLLAHSNYDVAHVHNVHGSYLQLNFVAQLLHDLPVLWTLHDMWALTGHCANSFDCNRWREGCGKCPYPATYPEVGVDHTAWLIRRKQISSQLSQRLVLAAPSQWMKDTVEQSILKNVRCEVIPNGVELSDLAHLDRDKTRAKLQIDPNEFVIAFGAHLGTSNPFKGADYALEALRKIGSAKSNGVFLSFGSDSKMNNAAADQNLPGFRQIRLGYLPRPELYQTLAAVDAFLMPSLGETLGILGLEALACGVPVVAFRTGGIPEYVVHKKTGFLCEPRQTDGLVNGLNWARGLSAQDRATFKAEARDLVSRRFSRQTQLQKYLEICGQLAEKVSSKP